MSKQDPEAGKLPSMRTWILAGALIGAIIPAIAWIASRGQGFGAGTLVTWPGAIFLFAASDRIRPNVPLIWTEAWLANIAWYCLLAALGCKVFRGMRSRRASKSGAWK